MPSIIVGVVGLSYRCDENADRGGLMGGCMEDLSHDIGGVLVGVGSVLVLLSIPALVYGAAEDPACADDAAVLTPSVAIAPTGGSLTWRF